MNGSGMLRMRVVGVVWMVEWRGVLLRVGEIREGGLRDKDVGGG